MNESQKLPGDVVSPTVPSVQLRRGPAQAIIEALIAQPWFEASADVKAAVREQLWAAFQEVVNADRAERAGDD
jgi:hypothetical protein